MDRWSLIPMYGRIMHGILQQPGNTQIPGRVAFHYVSLLEVVFRRLCVLPRHVFTLARMVLFPSISIDYLPFCYN